MRTILYCDLPVSCRSQVDRFDFLGSCKLEIQFLIPYFMQIIIKVVCVCVKLFKIGYKALWESVCGV
jgi:hypothetical protein